MKNTYQQGEEFETLAYHLVQDALDNLKFGLIPSCCKLSKKAPYRSAAREKDIIFDLSIEVRPVGAETRTLLYLIECKNYSDHKVPVDDVEEFWAKVSQVSDMGVKPVMITTNKFQSGAYTFAKNKGIMLIEVDEQKKLNIILYNSIKSNAVLKDLPTKSIIEELEELSNIQSLLFSGTETGKIDWDNLISKFLKHALQGELVVVSETDTPVLGLERLSQRVIEQLTVKILNQFNPNILKHCLAFPQESFQDFLYQKFGIELITSDSLADQDERSIRGGYDGFHKTITIDSSIVDTAKFGFVYAHEVAHFFLHSDVKMDQELYDSLPNSKFNATTGKHDLLNVRHFMEWQANQFASSILMPEVCVVARLIMHQKKEGIRNEGKIYFDNQPVNIQDFKVTIWNLADFFNVSEIVMEYRLADMGVITYAGGRKRPSTSFGYIKKPKTIAQIFGNLPLFNNQIG